MTPREQAIRRAFEECAHLPFEFGKMDCCLFVAKVVEEITGIDHSAAFRYVNETEAQDILFQNGGLSGLISKILGPSVPPEFLEVGDVALVHWKHETLMGIWMGDYVAVKTANRLAHLRTDYTVKGWRI
jgi:hypothetical protein